MYLNSPSVFEASLRVETLKRYKATVKRAPKDKEKAAAAAAAAKGGGGGEGGGSGAAGGS